MSGFADNHGGHELTAEPAAATGADHGLEDGDLQVWSCLGQAVCARETSRACSAIQNVSITCTARVRNTRTSSNDDNVRNGGLDHVGSVSTRHGATRLGFADRSKLVFALPVDDGRATIAGRLDALEWHTIGGGELSRSGRFEVLDGLGRVNVAARSGRDECSGGCHDEKCERGIGIGEMGKPLLTVGRGKESEEALLWRHRHHRWVRQRLPAVATLVDDERWLERKSVQGPTSPQPSQIDC